MKKKFRVICLITAIVFISVFAIGIVMSVALAEEERGTRGETVYISASADGTPQNMVSSVYISNPDGLDTVTDHTTLTDIKNITGNESPTVNGNDVTFIADGEDVCYQGAASGKLPFDVSIKFFLNGNETTPEEIAGKNGRVKIEVHTTNNLMRKAEVDGEMMDLYVVFSVICMMTLDDSLTGVTTEGAKLSAQAGQMTVLSVLMPGLASSLGVDESEKIKDTFTLEANASNFSLGQMMFIGMTGIVDENDLSGIEDIEGLLTALDDISAASTDLYTGSKKLYNGADNFYDGLDTYTGGVGDASDGAATASEGATKLASGTAELSGGISQLATAISTAVTKIDEASENAGWLTDADAPVDDAAKSAIESAVNEYIGSNADAIEQRARAALESELAPYIPDETTRNAVIDAVISGMDIGNLTIEISDEDIIAIRNAILATQEAQDMISSVGQLKTSADSLSEAAGKLASASTTLSSSMNTLADGLVTLADGLSTLDENSEALTKAAKSLVRGMGTLTEGLKTLSEEGLDAIVGETDKVKVSLSRKDALIALADGYTSFSSIESRPGDTVQFMLTTEEIIDPEPIEANDGESDVEASADASGKDENESKPFFKAIGDWFAGAWETIKSWFK